MKKRVLAMLLLCGMIFSVAGCNFKTDLRNEILNYLKNNVDIDDAKSEQQIESTSEQQIAYLEAIELSTSTKTNDYDVTNDGETDTILIQCVEPCEYETWGEFGYCWEILVNDQIVLTLKNECSFKPEVQLYQENESESYMAIKQCCEFNDDIHDYGLYQYTNGELEKVCDFYCNNIHSEHLFHYGAEIESMTNNKVVLQCGNQFNATAYISWIVEFDNKDNQWILSGNVYDIVYREYQQDKADGMTANQEFVVFTTTECNETAYTVLKGETVTIDKICIEDGEVFFHVTNKNAQEGWLKDPETAIVEIDGGYLNGYFEEAMFAG